MRSHKKDRDLHKRYYGSKQGFVRYLLANYPLVACQKIMQVTHMPEPHYLIKFTFSICGELFDFYQPEYKFPDTKFTTQDIAIMNGNMEVKECYLTYEQVVSLSNLINTIGKIKAKNPIYKERWFKRCDELFNKIAEEV